MRLSQQFVRSDAELVRSNEIEFRWLSSLVLACLCTLEMNQASVAADAAGRTRVSIVDGMWHINGTATYAGTPSEGLLMNVRMVNATFEDINLATGSRNFDPAANTGQFIERIPDYVNHGVRAFTICLQGGFPGYEGAINSAFKANGSLDESYLNRVKQVIECCDRNGVVVILGCFYQRQDQILRDDQAVRAGVVNVANWINNNRFTNVVLEIANEFAHRGYDHSILKSESGEAELITLAKATAPNLLVSTSGMGSGKLPDKIARASDFLLVHFNTTALGDYSGLIGALKQYGKPIVCNEDAKVDVEAMRAAQRCVDEGASWGLMLEKQNQHFPFKFAGAADDPAAYAALKRLTTSGEYYPPPESQGGWRKLEAPHDIRKLAEMDPAKLLELKQWLLDSDDRDFAAVIIRNGYIVLQVERGNSASTDSRRVASVSKAVCATVLAIASEQSQRGVTPQKMTFDDSAFKFIPWAQPLSDPRKAKITVKQLLNHTSGITPEATGARNQGPWKHVLGHDGNPHTETLAFEPGTDCGYSSFALYHASLVCEYVSGKPYSDFAVESLFRPIGCEHWWFQQFEAGGEKYGRHPSHAMGMPARDLARIAYCMLRGGRWNQQQVIPQWFVRETAQPTHSVKGPEMRFRISAETFSHGWELPARLTGHGDTPSGHGIPSDARYKPGSGGQLIAFVPSLDLVVTRQTGSSGPWQYAEYLRRACAAVLGADSIDR